MGKKDKNRQFTLGSWFFACIFLLLHFIYLGFPPKYPEDFHDCIYLGIALILFVFPVITKLTIGKFGIEKDPFFRPNPDTTPATPISQIEKDIPANDEKVVFLKSRMGYSFANENLKEDISIDSLDWAYNSRNLFWLGQNLTYIKALIISGGPLHLITLALRQAYTHMKILGLEKSISIRSIVALLYRFKDMKTLDEDINTRDRYAQIVQECIYRIGRLCTDYQNMHLDTE